MTRLCVGILALAAVATSMLAPSSANAIEYPWCMRFGGSMGGASNCGFTTLAQCHASLTGGTDYCEMNPFYNGSPARTKHGRNG